MVITIMMFTMNTRPLIAIPVSLLVTGGYDYYYRVSDVVRKLCKPELAWTIIVQI